MSELVIYKFRKSMVMHDTECPYWDQVSLNNITQWADIRPSRRFSAPWMKLLFIPCFKCVMSAVLQFRKGTFSTLCTEHHFLEAGIAFDLVRSNVLDKLPWCLKPIILLLPSIWTWLHESSFKTLLCKWQPSSFFAFFCPIFATHPFCKAWDFLLIEKDRKGTEYHS